MAQNTQRKAASTEKGAHGHKHAHTHKATVVIACPLPPPSPRPSPPHEEGLHSADGLVRTHRRSDSSRVCSRFLRYSSMSDCLRM